jgi:tetratricopeptide (TPR) repeat protein
MRKASALVVRFVAIAAGLVLAVVGGDRQANAQDTTPPPHRHRSSTGGTGAATGASSTGTSGGGSPGASTGAANRGYKSQPLNLKKQQLGSAGLPDIARARMRNGDLPGALDAFDAALETLTDPTLYRDRGLCHEKLGHVYPAIDDYRVYLTESPDAADVDGITARLHALEDQVSGKTTPAVANDDVPPGLRIGEAEETAAMKDAPANGSTKDHAQGSPATSTSGATRPDKVDYASDEEDALHSPLRAGRGWSLAPLLALHKWLFQGDSFGDSESWSESFGIQVRYAFGPSGALVMELGYEHFNSTSIDPAVISGLTSQVAYEFRFPLDPEYDNQVFIAPGLGFENLVYTFSNEGTASDTAAAFVPRIRLGWRHMLQPSTALDVAFDAGVANFFQYSHFPFDSNNPATGLLALEASVAWGL